MPGDQTPRALILDGMAYEIWDTAFSQWTQYGSHPGRIPRSRQAPAAAKRAAQDLYTLIEDANQIDLALRVAHHGGHARDAGKALARAALHAAAHLAWTRALGTELEITPVTFTVTYDGKALTWTGEALAENPCRCNPDDEDEIDQRSPPPRYAPAGLMEDLARSLPAACPRDHKALVQGGPEWNRLTLLGYQDTDDDDGNPRLVELRNCTCGSTLGRLLPVGATRAGRV